MTLIDLFTIRPSDTTVNYVLSRGSPGRPIYVEAVTLYVLQQRGFTWLSGTTPIGPTGLVWPAGSISGVNGHTHYVVGWPKANPTDAIFQTRPGEDLILAVGPGVCEDFCSFNIRDWLWPVDFH